MQNPKGPGPTGLGNSIEISRSSVAFVMAPKIPLGPQAEYQALDYHRKVLKSLGKVWDGTANHGSTRRSQVPQLAKTARALATWGGVGRAVVCGVSDVTVAAG